VARPKKLSHKEKAVGGTQRPLANRKLLITGLEQIESSQVCHLQTKKDQQVKAIVTPSSDNMY